MSSKQKTLNAPVVFNGRGLHTGVAVKMTVSPAPENHGLKFRRTDVEGAPEIPALADFVVDTSRSTTLGKSDVRISTVEHILAALWTMGVDNALIEIDGPEVPIMDGSAREYAEAIDTVGLIEQEEERKYYQVTEKISFAIPEKGVEIDLYPDDHFSASVHLDYNSRVLGNQYAVFDPSKESFREQIAPCRTFVFLHELEPLLAGNLIKGGDLDNAIVVVEKEVAGGDLERLRKLFNKPDIEIHAGYLNNIDLHFPNETARHKLLDVLGDFALLGVRIRGRIMATRQGHFANTETVKMMRKAMRKEGLKPTCRYNPNEEPVFDVNAIKNRLPHRPPFLLVDKIIHIDDQSIAGIKSVTVNEPFFVGHFPDEPVMPGVLIVEAMAQCGGILALHGMDPDYFYSTYFLKIDSVRFKMKVVPGDVLQFELRLVEPIRRGLVHMEARAFVGDRLAAEADLLAQVTPSGKRP
ncbi:MAG: bifunctional UDP-3-O-[3-hydroxymyristoyl] N-acetylglucosamine deacetylase/3-hydroxyacyl-ACP dehydratase [Alistipes sp.]|jgi:UDP-3-O-[3-hydroxymyristoyl] N-acetylglucosamine deacetylase/3-hydroxyacyl-[acyl-carrier-protein] dehydratase|nr:bifunctional UDP-3-O-[3-hydroxymyristoyl] N-acetylglucosamine deacetylase/3-hydroxyacyl-ACP dehydratase [Alistipes sp.]